MQPWEVKQRRYLLERPWITLRQDHVVLPGGAEMEEFHVIEYPNWAATICLDEQNELVMVEQYRHGIQRPSLEFPAGVIEKDEEPLIGAQRELLEETGYVSSSWTSLGRCSTDPSNHSNYAYFFLAERSSFQQSPTLDLEEELCTRKISVDDLPRLIENGTIIHGLHIAAIMKAHVLGVLPLTSL